MFERAKKKSTDRMTRFRDSKTLKPFQTRLFLMIFMKKNK